MQAIRSAGGKSRLAVDAVAEAGHRQRSKYEANWVIQIRDRATGNIVVNHTIRITLSASGGT